MCQKFSIGFLRPDQKWLRAFLIPIGAGFCIVACPFPPLTQPRIGNSGATAVSARDGRIFPRR